MAKFYAKKVQTLVLKNTKSLYFLAVALPNKLKVYTLSSARVIITKKQKPSNSTINKTITTTPTTTTTTKPITTTTKTKITMTTTTKQTTTRTATAKTTRQQQQQ